IEPNERDADQSEHDVIDDTATTEDAAAPDLSSERIGDDDEVVREEGTSDEERHFPSVAQHEARKRICDRDERAREEHREDRKQDHQEPTYPPPVVHLTQTREEQRQDRREARRAANFGRRKRAD